ncbi:hypothetical protein [Sphingobacterium sp. IITKGP-BTPF85]|uniref:hypothetical protein n=1 Tax=Sphingobacterium sp. IITKGP-BTPF85 TaxID=1338009 RepID=UPI00038A16C9|nr:hypothetical protein [Sphingobacterium sp. IITKGP-BTPF85]KKX49997.1 hypothetical protein L950_0212530 [Sphingobacterium sp. IITKGP-BTPF85]
MSSIKLGAQMLLMKNDIPRELLLKLANNILDASALITEMIDKVHELSKSNSVALNLEILDPKAISFPLLRLRKINTVLMVWILKWGKLFLYEASEL